MTMSYNLAAREKHLPNLLLSSQPGMLYDLEIVPGISDHEAITFIVLTYLQVSA